MYATTTNSELMFDLCIGSDVVCSDQLGFFVREWI